MRYTLKRLNDMESKRYFKIAETGFCITSIPQRITTGKYLEKFQISYEEYADNRDRIEIEVQMVEKLTDNRKKASYGHYKEAVSFLPGDWEKEKVTWEICFGLYEEPGVSLNQLFSLTGVEAAFLSRQGIVIHASYILTDKGAVLFTAPSQTGKSTQAELWRKYAGAEVINGDRVILKREERGWYACGIPVCGSSDVCKNVTKPIWKIVVLEQGKENKVIEMRISEQYKALLLASAYDREDKKQTQLVHENILQLLSEGSAVKLICRPNEDAVRTLQDYLKGGK